MMAKRVDSPLLGPNDRPPFEVVNSHSGYPVVLICEHAGRAIPEKLGSLGLDDNALEKHIAWDIGAAELARDLAERLGATLVLQTYSRLVIDCNRPVDAADAMPPISDGIPIPANADLSDRDRQARIDEISTPFHRCVDAVLDEGRCKAAIAIHSFTPILNGIPRPWDMGFLYRKDEATSHKLAARICERNPDLIIGLNQPYQISDLSDWFVPRHGERRQLPHSLIEIRNDHLSDPHASAVWAERLADAIDTLAKAL